PVIRQQPRNPGNLNDCDPVNLALDLEPSCRPVQFQWFKNGVPLLSETNSNIRFLANAETAGNYIVQVANSFASATSQVTTVTIDVLRPPPNDDFANRFTLKGTNVLTSGTNILASAETGEPSHEAQAPRRSVWWTWQSPVPSRVTIDFGGSDIDPLFGLYTGS